MKTHELKKDIYKVSFTTEISRCICIDYQIDADKSYKLKGTHSQ